MSPQRDRAATSREIVQPRIAITSSTETLLRELLAASGRRDADARVVGGVRLLLGAEWVALFEEEDSEWICRCGSGPGPGSGERWPGGACDLQGRPSRAEFSTMALDLDVGARRAILLVGPRSGGGDHSERQQELLRRVAPDLALTLRKGDELDTLRSQAFVDALTECYNRRGFDEHLQVELMRAQRYQRAAALMLVDLDGFKRINDQLGHQVGDHVLRRFAGLLTSSHRTTDVVTRYGGDEFAVIFPETTTEEAVPMAERIRTLLGRIFPDTVVSRPVTASFGIASYPADSSTAKGLVAAADRALYAAKEGGRDRVVAAPFPESTEL